MSAVARVEGDVVKPRSQVGVTQARVLGRGGRQDEPLRPAGRVGGAPSAAAVFPRLGREAQAAHERVVEAGGRVDVTHAQAQVVDEARRKLIGHVENVAPASTHP